MTRSILRWVYLATMTISVGVASACGGGGDSLDDELAACQDRCRQINQSHDGQMCLGCFPRAASASPADGSSPEPEPIDARFALDGDTRAALEEALLDQGPLDMNLRDDSDETQQLLLEPVMMDSNR